MKDTVEKLLTIISACEQEEVDKVRLHWHEDVFACPACEAPIETRHHNYELDRTWVEPCECVLTPEQVAMLRKWVSDTNPNVVRHCKSMRALVQLCGTLIKVGQDYKQLKGITTSESQAWSEGRADMALSALRLLAGAYDVPYETDPDQFERLKTAVRHGKEARR